MILILDNRDSFTFNIAQLLMELGPEVEVLRSDRNDWAAIEARRPTGLLIGPGPGRPAGAGSTMECLAAAPLELPILGVCLGHQAIAEHFGADLIKSEPVHGHEELIQHDGAGLFKGITSPLTVGRYHSLLVRTDTLPECLEASASTASGLLMGLRHRERPIESVQFHPESILSSEGRAFMANFIERCGEPAQRPELPSGNRT
ncbi:MAG: aminodeoxychorismate/anthranilate synthase component II [Planctomycetota bacterium]|nr:aminodeoxychorismate/anthranilate synthase component II [Planctomycetota bacterium]